MTSAHSFVMSPDVVLNADTKPQTKASPYTSGDWKEPRYSNLATQASSTMKISTVSMRDFLDTEAPYCSVEKEYLKTPQPGNKK